MDRILDLSSMRHETLKAKMSVPLPVAEHCDCATNGVIPYDLVNGKCSPQTPVAMSAPDINHQRILRCEAKNYSALL